MSGQTRQRSRVAELAEAEAARAEAEDDDALPAGDTPPDETDAEQDDRDDETEARSMQESLKALDLETVRHADAVAGIMGADFEAFTPCGYCDQLGFVPITAPKFDPETERCDRCDGHGHMLTGSANELHVIRECTACQGTGYRMKAPPMPDPTPPASYPLPDPGFRYDPMTGQPLPNGAQPSGTWAPGYTPQGSPSPR